MPKTPDWTLSNRRVLVVGPSGSGKSSWLEVLLRGAVDRIAAWDPKGEMQPRYGLPTWSDPEPSRVAAAMTWSSAFNPHPHFPGQLEKAFTLWTSWVWASVQALPGRALVVIDELQDVITTNANGVPPGLMRLLQSGRGFGADIVCLSQASNEVAARLRNQFNEVVTFATTEKRALDFLNAFGLNPREVADLPARHFIHRSRDTGAQKLGRITFDRGGRARIEAVTAAPAAAP